MGKKAYYKCRLFRYPKARIELSVMDSSPHFVNIFCPGFFTITLSVEQAKGLKEQLQLALRLAKGDLWGGGR
ncbi:hypothetical protein ES703_51858 [subsurface metagenome]